MVTSTFLGRDVFAPAAAHLARGASFASLGPAIDGPLVASPLPAARVVDGAIETEVVYEDTFGNVKLSALAADVRDAFGEPRGREFRLVVADGRVLELPWAGTFGERSPGDPLLYEDSYGRVCVGVNQGSAVEALALRDGDRLELRPR